MHRDPTKPTRPGRGLKLGSAYDGCLAVGLALLLLGGIAILVFWMRVDGNVGL